MAEPASVAMGVAGDLHASGDVADDCDDEVPDDAEAACLERAYGGYCTWRCGID